MTKKQQQQLERLIGEVDLDGDDRLLVEKHLQVIVKFKQLICTRSKKVDPNEEMDWTDLSYGFFVGQGIMSISEQDPKRVENVYDDAYKLATLVRYRFHYWQH